MTRVSPMTPCMVVFDVAARATSLEVTLRIQHPTSQTVLFLPPRRQTFQSFTELTCGTFLADVSSFPLVSATGAPGASGSPQDVLQILRSLPALQRPERPAVSVQVLL